MQGERLRQQVLKFTDPPLIKDRKVSDITRLKYRNIAISCINIRIVIPRTISLQPYLVKKGSHRDVTLPLWYNHIFTAQQWSTLCHPNKDDRFLF